MLKKYRALAVISAVILIIILGCLILKNQLSGPEIKKSAISGIQELALNEQDISQLGIAKDFNEQTLQQLGIEGNNTNCKTEDYSNIIDSSIGQHSLCIYNISGLNNTQVIVELQKFANYESLNGSYQYDSSHLYSIKGLISENTYGDQSRFRVNNVNDYGGQYNDPNVFYYHLWITKDLYLLHITSGGAKEAEDYIPKIGQLILSKFG